MGALVGPVAEAMRAIKRGGVQAGETVAVVGCGTIGLFAIQCARVAGAEQVIAIEPQAARREAALECGAKEVVDPFVQNPVEAVKGLLGGKGADVVIECAGTDATGITAGRLAKTRGRIVILGIFERPAPMDYFDLVVNEKTVLGSVSGHGGFEEAISLMAEGKILVEPLITKEISLVELPPMLEAITAGKDNNIKVLVLPV